MEREENYEPRLQNLPLLVAASTVCFTLDDDEEMLAAAVRPAPLSEAAGPQGKDARRPGDYCSHFSPAPCMVDCADDLPFDLSAFFRVAEEQKKLEEEKEMTAAWVKRMKEGRERDGKKEAKRRKLVKALMRSLDTAERPRASAATSSSNLSASFSGAVGEADRGRAGAADHGKSVADVQFIPQEDSQAGGFC